jgi:hypothetical protein
MIPNAPATGCGVEVSVVLSIVTVGSLLNRNFDRASLALDS